MSMSIAIAQFENRGYRVFLRDTHRVSLSRRISGRCTIVHVYLDGSVEYDVWNAPNY